MLILTFISVSMKNLTSPVCPQQFSFIPFMWNLIFIFFTFFLLKSNSLMLDFHWLAPRSIHSIGCNAMSVRGYVVPTVYNRNQEGWRLLVKELIDKIAKVKTPFFLGFCHFLGCKYFFLHWFFVVLLGYFQIVHGGWVSRGSVCGYGCWRWCHVKVDMWHGTHDTWHMTHDTWHMSHYTWQLTYLKK